jgi:glycosyltransferase involved in cell wall biosynthesis
LKILWVTNFPLPTFSEIINKSSNPYGGWLVNSSKLLSENNNVDLSVLSPFDNSLFSPLTKDNIRFYGFKKSVNKKFSLHNILYFQTFLNQIKPDLVHINGTEFFHSYYILEACNRDNIKVVTSIQGLLSVYSDHIYANLPIRIIKGNSLRNLIMKDNLLNLKKYFKYKGLIESNLIKNSEYVIGRTSWDYINTKKINNNVKYLKCNEMLRSSFYVAKKWDIKSISKYTIFMSQGHYSIKGIHIAIEALIIVKMFYPQATITIAGRNNYSDDFISKLKATKYTKYIKNLILKSKLNNSVFFVGELNEKGIINYYLNSHVFLLSSSVENSPNSMGEAMLLGIPTICSFVGGIPDFINNDVNGLLYPFDSPELLAHQILRIFNSDDLAIKLSMNSIKDAAVTHNQENIIARLINIYKEVLK